MMVTSVNVFVASFNFHSLVLSLKEEMELNILTLWAWGESVCVWRSGAKVQGFQPGECIAFHCISPLQLGSRDYSFPTNIIYY